MNHQRQIIAGSDIAQCDDRAVSLHTLAQKPHKFEFVYFFIRKYHFSFSPAVYKLFQLISVACEHLDRVFWLFYATYIRNVLRNESPKPPRDAFTFI